MNLNALLKFMVLHMMNQSENDSNRNAPAKINHSPEIELVNLPPMIEETENDLNKEFRQSYESTNGLFPTFDCSMPRPPTFVTEIPPIKQQKIKNYGVDASTQSSNIKEVTKEIAIKENINPQETQSTNKNDEELHSKASIRIDLNHQSPNVISKQLEPESKQVSIENVKKSKMVEDEMIGESRAKASMQIPIDIVHKLPDAQVLDLMR